MDKVTWLYIDLNSFFASCEQQENPQLRGLPVAVVPMLADTTFVIAASYQAKKFGVKTGTRVGDAKKMCKGLRLIEADHDIYVRYHHRVIQAVDKCVPVEAVCSIDEIAVKLTGSQQDPEKAKQLALHIKDTLKRDVGEVITASIGISTSRFMAKIATDMQKPDGLTFVFKRELPQKLFELKLQDILGIGKKTEAHLIKNGITNVKQLCELSQDEMRKMWGGVWGERMYLWLRGEEVSLPPSKTHSVSHEHVLPPNLRTADGSLMVAKKLLAKLAVRLRKNSLYTKSLNVYVRFMDDGRTPNDGWSRSKTDAHWDATTRFDELRDTISLLHKLDELWRDCPKNKKPFKVSVQFGDLVQQATHQFSLFDDPKKDQLSLVMDKINRKYGRETLHLGATHEHKESAPTRIAFKRIPDLDELE